MFIKVKLFGTVLWVQTAQSSQALSIHRVLSRGHSLYPTSSYSSLTCNLIERAFVFLRLTGAERFFYSYQEAIFPLFPIFLQSLDQSLKKPLKSSLLISNSCIRTYYFDIIERNSFLLKRASPTSLTTLYKMISLINNLRNAHFNNMPFFTYQIGKDY